MLSRHLIRRESAPGPLPFAALARALSGNPGFHPHGRTQAYCAQPMRPNKKDAPKGALHANKFPRRGAPRLRRQCA